MVQNRGHDQVPTGETAGRPAIVLSSDTYEAEAMPVRMLIGWTSNGIQ